MSTYGTTSGHSDLNGSCEITGVKITEYKSKKLGKATKIENNGSGSDLLAFVTFPGHKKPFMIAATKNGLGNFDGNADDDANQEETWAATATAGKPAAAAKGAR